MPTVVCTHWKICLSAEARCSRPAVGSIRRLPSLHWHCVWPSGSRDAPGEQRDSAFSAPQKLIGQICQLEGEVLWADRLACDSFGELVLKRQLHTLLTH